MRFFVGDILDEIVNNVKDKGSIIESVVQNGQKRLIIDLLFVVMEWDGQTTLHFSCERDYEFLVSWLLKHDTEVNASEFK